MISYSFDQFHSTCTIVNSSPSEVECLIILFTTAALCPVTPGVDERFH